MRNGSGVFTFNDHAAGQSGSLQVFYHRPEEHGRHDRILLAISGSDRAAAYFRNCWVAHAKRLNALIVAPEFDHASFPTTAIFNYGNVTAPQGDVSSMMPREVWTYGILDRLFRRVKEITASEQSSFSLFGHSAGAQFAHRYLALTRGRLTDLVIAANAGWYMLPDNGMEYPAGTARTGFSDEDLRRYLATNMVILLGDADTNETEPGLPQEAEAVAQGAHRLARGRFYFNYCRDLARRLDATFGWRLVVAPGIGHDDAEISTAAANVVQAL